MGLLGLFWQESLLQGRLSQTVTKDSLFSILPRSGKPNWGKESEVAMRMDSIVIFVPDLNDNRGFYQVQVKRRKLMHHLSRSLIQFMNIDRG